MVHTTVVTVEEGDCLRFAVHPGSNVTLEVLPSVKIAERGTRERPEGTEVDVDKITRRERRRARNGLIGDLYTKGWTLQAIADLFGVTRERVRQIVGKAGARRPSRTAVERFALEHGTAIDATFSRMHNSDEVAKRLGLRPGSVRRYLKEAGRLHESLPRSR